MLNVHPEFVNEEDIVAKLQYIEYLDHRWPYPPTQGKDYYARVRTSLQSINPEYHELVLAIFASVIYLPEPILKDTWPYLLSEAARRCDASVTDIVETSMLFESNGSGILYDFINRNKIEGRLDVDRYARTSSIEQLIERLLLLASSPNHTAHKGLEEDVKFILGKRFWLLLIDNALSGTSLCSELERAAQVLKLLRLASSTTRIIPLVQVYTVDAEAQFEKEFGQLKEFVLPPIYGLYFDSRFKICPGNSECELFKDSDTFERVVQFCRWFAEETDFANDARLEETKRISGDGLQFGFKAGGWTIVPSPNCPTNSLPVLWYSNPRFYQGPFPRVLSRLSQRRGRSGENLDALLERCDDLLKRLA